MADNLDQFIQQSKQASQSRFQNIQGAVAQHGYYFNPVTGTFDRDPSYVDPSQQAQIGQLTDPSAIALKAGAEAAAQYGAQQGLPATAQDVQNYYDPATGQQAQPGVKKADLNTGKYRYLDPSDIQYLQGINRASSLTQQIKDASNGLNTESGGKTAYSAGQEIKGFLAHLGLSGTAAKNNANFLTNVVPGVLTEITSSLLQNNRYSSSEIGQLRSTIPQPTDTKEVALAKIGNFEKIVDNARKSVLSGNLGGTGTPTSTNSSTTSKSSGTNNDPLGIR